jgi:type II secretory pathway pseudopilin PulG
MKNLQKGIMQIIVFIIIGIVLLIALATFFSGISQTKQTTSTKSTTPDQSVSQGQVNNCANDYNPVCGSDGLTYENSCFARLHSVNSVSSGACSGSSVNQVNNGPVYNQFPYYQAPNSGIQRVTMYNCGVINGASWDQNQGYCVNRSISGSECNAAGGVTYTESCAMVNGITCNHISYVCVFNWIR